MDEQDLSGTVLNGRYRLGERLGAGGWGSVYAAVQIDLGRPVAIKVLHKNVALSSDGLLRFEREAKSAAALGHPNISQVSDFQANPGDPPFLVMELLTGNTLGYILREQTPKLPAARMAWIAYQILAGLDVAHHAGIVHRDIKPDNVFLVAMPGVEDFVKLLDFGIAKLAGDASSHLTTTGTMLGSPAFMAPEQVKSNDVDHRVDIYAVGATMYLALAGQMPFNAPTVHGLLLAITEQRAMPLHVVDPSIDPAISAVVERAMHKDRNGRFGSAEEMRRALEPWLGGMAAHASATASGPRMVGAGGGGAKGTAAIPSVPATVPGHVPPTSNGPWGPGTSAMSGPPLGTPAPGTPYGSPPTPQFGGAPAPPYGTPAPYGALPSPQFGAPTPQDAAAQAQYAAPAAGHASSVTPAPAPAKARGAGAIIGLLAAVVVLLLLVVGGGIGAFVVYGHRSSDARAGGAAGTTGAGGAGATAAPASSAPASHAPAAGAAGGAAGAAGVAAPRAAGAAGPGAKPLVGVAPGGQPGAAGPVAIVTDAGAGGAAAPPAAKKQFAGSSFRFSGGSFGVFEIEPSKAAINRMGGAIGACYAATEFDPPDHQFTSWTFQVDPAGNVKSVGRTTSFEPHPKFDACMIGALRQVKWPVTPSGGSPQVSFNSRTRDNP